MIQGHRVVRVVEKSENGSRRIMRQSLADRHEREMSGLFPEAQVTIASGSQYEKSDIQSKPTENNRYWRSLIECKCTQNKGFTITRELWGIVQRRALERSSHARPVLSIRFYGGDDHLSVDNVRILADLVVLDSDDYIELLRELETLRNRANIV